MRKLNESIGFIQTFRTRGHKTNEISLVCIIKIKAFEIRIIRIMKMLASEDEVFSSF